MPLHNHLLSFPEESVTKPKVDDYATSQPHMVSTESDPLLPKQEPGHAESETRTLAYACVLTTFFFLVELVGGYVAGSLAIISDAAHLLSDLAGFAISLLAVAVSRLPPNAQMSFGFARAEVLGAFVSILFIWALTAVLVIAAIERLFNPSPVDGPIMLGLGIIGLLVNIVLGCVLGHDAHGHDHDHSHSHGHGHDQGHSDDHNHSHEGNHGHDHRHNDGSHQHIPDALGRASGDHLHDVSRNPQCDSECDVESGSHSVTVQTHSGVSRDPDDSGHDSDHRESAEVEQAFWRSLFFGSDQKSVNLRAAYLHVLGDALQNVGVIVAAIIMTVNPDLSFIDPMCTLVFAGIVLVTTKDLAKETMTVLMEGTPPAMKLDDIYAELIRINGVASVGDLHVWSITPRRPALSVHLYQKADSRGHDLIKDAQKVLADRFGIFHATIQVNCDTSACCDNGLYFEARSGQNNCISYNHTRTNGS